MNEKGFSTLYIVIVLGSVVLALAIASSTTNIFALKSAMNFENSARARAVTNACAEIVLEKIKLNHQHSGEYAIVIDSHTCNYNVTKEGNSTRLISVSARVSDVVRKLEIETVSFNPLQISSWKEI